MTVDQLPGRVREFVDYLNGLLAHLDQGGGWCAVFWQRDPHGMRACLDGREVPPWDVLEALLQDLATVYGPDAAAREAERARPLHAAAIAAYDVRPGGRESLDERLDAMLREQRHATERRLELGRLLTSAPTRQQAEALRLDLAWARDDHERATARCAELRSRMAELDRQTTDPTPDLSSGGASRAAAPDSSFGGVSRAAAPGSSFGGASRAAAPGSSFGGVSRAAAPDSSFGGASRAGSPASSSDRAARAAAPAQPGPPERVRRESISPESTWAEAAWRESALHEPVGHEPVPPEPIQYEGVRPESVPPGSARSDPAWSASVRSEPVWSPAVWSEPAQAESDLPGSHRSGVPRSAPVHPRPTRREPYSPEPTTRQPEPTPRRPEPGLASEPKLASEPGLAPAPDLTPQPPPPAPKQRKRRRGSARFAGMDEGEVEPVVVPPSAGPGLPAPDAGGCAPRGARFAGAGAEAPGWAQPRVEAVDVAGVREVAGVVAGLVRLRGEGRSGEAHVLLTEAAHWPPARLPLLAEELGRAGLGADWATLLWEAASLPAGRLVAAADALVAAGRGADGEQILRQGVVRPAAEVGRAVLELAAEGRHREVHALLDAYVRVRTPEEAARSAEPGPVVLVPLLLEAALGVSDERHWDLVHALRVAGFAT